MSQSRVAALFIAALLPLPTPVAEPPISGPAYTMINQRTAAVRSAFYVYLDEDAGYNHGFASGFFPSDPVSRATIHLDTACIDDPDDPNAVHGCAPGSPILDRVRGTVMRVTFDPQTPGNFAGINIEEPENWGKLQAGTGYDLRGALNVVFDVRSPDGATLQFGVGGCTTNFVTLPKTWTRLTVRLNSCIPDLSNVHILFAVAANSLYTAGGGTVLLDNIRFDPVPTSQQTALGFPFANQTFGVVPLQDSAPGRVPIPPDQLLRNLGPIYESSLVELLLLNRGTAPDIAGALLIAQTLDYALHHENPGDPLPPAGDGSVALHNAYEDGDVWFLNDQASPKLGKAGDARLSGFTSGTSLCGTSGFCLVLDGATGGNNAFAILALLAAYKQFGDLQYLEDARTIGNWIVGNLTDTTGTGYGGYYVGYPDEGHAKVLIPGKSVENNADIFAAFTRLAAIESELGNAQEAAAWTVDANVAGDFVMRMFDSVGGYFFAGTVQVGSSPDPAAGNCQVPYRPKGSDLINTCDFLDANTFTTLALAPAARYHQMIDWRRPVQHVLDTFAQSVTAAGHEFRGFDIVKNPSAGPNGIAWEFTGQAVETMRFVDRMYGETRFEAPAAFYLAQIRQAQIMAPFGDRRGVVASTLQHGDILEPIDQCLSTPFQCIAERVGLAATGWAIAAELNINPFGPIAPSRRFSP